MNYYYLCTEVVQKQRRDIKLCRSKAVLKQIRHSSAATENSTKAFAG
jgi:hypothetical protein